jgi:hypothetical protein
VSVKLDWQIEAERVYQRVGEDPRERRRRWRTRLRIVMFTLLVFAIAGGLVGLVALRLSTVDSQIRQALIDTARAEVTALRIGDYGAFIAIQRSASDNWIRAQNERFNRYQQLKVEADLQLTGVVVDAVVDGQRGRVILEERIEGVPYHTAWFYWRYSDGWRHVPSDYTFWGDPGTIDGQTATVQYRAVDARLAGALAPRLDRWWAEGCAILGCEPDLRMTAHIVPNPGLAMHWDGTRPNTLIVPAPLAADERARADADLPVLLEGEIARYVAERLVDLANGGLRPAANADSAWLRQNIIEWLTTRFAGRGDVFRLGFVQSLYDGYGPEALAATVRALPTEIDLGAVARAVGQPIETLALDWRAFFQWRLDVEKTLLARNDQAGVAALWDLSDPAAQAAMRQRMSVPLQATAQVQSVEIVPGPDGTPRAVVPVIIEGNPAVVQFRLVDGVWRRSS